VRPSVSLVPPVSDATQKFYRERSELKMHLDYQIRYSEVLARMNLPDESTISLMDKNRQNHFSLRQRDPHHSSYARAYEILASLEKDKVQFLELITSKINQVRADLESADFKTHEKDTHVFYKNYKDFHDSIYKK
jgi:hypothetical protein